MGNLYVIVPKNCTGCRTCELACAMVKGSNGTLGRSRIRVFPIREGSYVQMNCLQCVEAACVRACPSKALVRNETSRAVELDAGRCIGCALCAAACPFGHIHFDRATAKPLKCDLCGGEPACAKFCPHRALEVR
jgi:carbon-monoxide dehydrogenase iron sulfur subunit